MKDFKVICLGEALVDRLGPLGGDPSIDKPVQDCLGGAPANVSCALSRLGMDVSFVGCLGNDFIGKEFQNLFISRGVDIAGLQINNSIPSRIVLVRRDASGERTFGGFEGNQGNGFSDQLLQLSELKKIWSDLVQGVTWIVLGTIPLASPTSNETVLWVVEQAKELGIDIAIDINWRPTFWRDSLSPDSPPSKEVRSLINVFLEKASFLKLAKEEAIWFFNSTEPHIISDSFNHKPNVVITDGSKPIKWYLNGVSGCIEPFSPYKVIDTTGAGDSFMAGLISQFPSNFSTIKDYLELEKKVRFAAACGALVCGGLGAIDPQPSYSDVQNFLDLSAGD